MNRSYVIRNWWNLIELYNLIMNEQERDHLIIHLSILLQSTPEQLETRRLVPEDVALNPVGQRLHDLVPDQHSHRHRKYVVVLLERALLRLGHP